MEHVAKSNTQSMKEFSPHHEGTILGLKEPVDIVLKRKSRVKYTNNELPNILTLFTFGRYYMKCMGCYQI
jgi:hypothetical protein